jgi:hypothetical protein
MTNKKRQYYAEGIDHGHIGLNSFANVSGEVYVFNSKKERDDFVYKFEWYEGIVCARAIKKNEALRLSGYRDPYPVKTTFFGSPVEKLLSY